MKMEEFIRQRICIVCCGEWVKSEENLGYPENTFEYNKFRVFCGQLNECSFGDSDLPILEETLKKRDGRLSVCENCLKWVEFAV